MGKCIAPGCKNSSDQKVKMCSFPKNGPRREIWIKNSNIVHLPKFEVLCEFHFTPEQWEKPRCDGSKKLKCNAVPTIFGEEVQRILQMKKLINKTSQDMLSSQTEDAALSSSSVEIEIVSSERPCNSISTSVVSNSVVKKLNPINNVQAIFTDLCNKVSFNSTDTTLISHSSQCSKQTQQLIKTIKILEEKLRIAETKYLRSETLRSIMKTRHKAIYRKIKAKFEKLGSNAAVKFEIFNQDQASIVHDRKKSKLSSTVTSGELNKHDRIEVLDPSNTAGDCSAICSVKMEFEEEPVIINTEQPYFTDINSLSAATYIDPAHHGCHLNGSVVKLEDIKVEIDEHSIPRVCTPDLTGKIKEEIGDS